MVSASMVRVGLGLASLIVRVGFGLGLRVKFSLGPY
jgi:hypothetical protein